MVGSWIFIAATSFSFGLGQSGWSPDSQADMAYLSPWQQQKLSAWNPGWNDMQQKRSGLEDLENWDDTPQVSRSWRDIMPKKRNIDVLPQASNDYRFANGFQGRMFNLKRSAGAPVLIPQASNNYRFANGFQGRMINLKRSGGAPLKIEMEDDEDTQLPVKMVSKRNPGCLSALAGKPSTPHNAMPSADPRPLIMASEHALQPAFF